MLTTRNTWNNAKLDQHAEAIRSLGRQTISNIAAIGRHLHAARELAGRGNWQRWLKQELGLSPDTAARFMGIATLDGQRRNLRHLNLSASSLYMLAAPSVPETVRDTIMAEAEATPLKHQEVRQRINAARPAQPRIVEEHDDDEFVEAVHAARAVVDRAAPISQGEVPAEFEQNVSIVESVFAHVLNRQRVAIFKSENMPPKLRDQLLDCLKFNADQILDLIADLEEPTTH